MMLPSITNENASIAWNSMDTTNEFDASSLVLEYIGLEEDSKFTDIELDDLVEELNAIKTFYEKKYAEALPKAVGGEVDAKVVKSVHKHLSRYCSVDQLSRLGFWRWLSNVAHSGFFWRFLKWRFKDKKQINWGITSSSRIVEVYFYRSWLRGYLMYDPKLSDPYKYAQKGASDVWRSHIFRQEFGRDINFVKAFLDVIVDDNGKTLITAKEMRHVVIPAIRAWTSNATFSHLSYDECGKLIKTLINEGI